MLTQAMDLASRLRSHHPAPSCPRLSQARSCRQLHVACRNSRDGPKGDGAQPFRHPEMDSPGSSSMVPDTLPFMGSDTDWREFRAKLVASERVAGTSTSSSSSSINGSGNKHPASSQSSGQWAHVLPRPEKGCLLLAHPALFRQTQTYFHMAVIFMLEHSEQGSYGIILNRASEYTLSEVNLTTPLPEFDSRPLYVGGDVGGGEITMLHTHANLEDSVEVVKGIYTGDIEPARQAVRDGRASATDFRFFAKYAGWGPGQLESECMRGVWFTAAASPSVLMQEPRSADGSDVWHAVLQLMGGDYQQLSDNIKTLEARRAQGKASPAGEGVRPSAGESAGQGEGGAQQT